MRPFGALALEILSMAEPNDSRWLASLLRHGLVQGSFIPPRDIRELLDLTRRRRTLVSDGAAERNRVQKILEGANVKIGNVLSDVFGTSGQAMLEALLENKRSAAEIAELGHWSLAPKIPQIIEALEGHRMTDHHRFMIRQCLRHMRTLEEMIEELDKEIALRLKPYQQQVKLACTVPGIKPTGLPASFAPWIRLERSVARKTMAWAISSGVDVRPAGCLGLELLEIFSHDIGAFRASGSRAHRIEANAPRTVFRRPVFGKQVDGCLARAIQTHAGRPIIGHHGRYIHNRSLALLRHERSKKSANGLNVSAAHF